MTIESVLEQILKELRLMNDFKSRNINSGKTDSLKETKIFYTFKEWNQHHPWPTEAGLRWIRFHEKNFKAEKCFKKVSRRVLIDEEEFLKWIDSNPQIKNTME